MNDLKDLLKHEIEDLYSVEEQIIEALPKMIGKANNENLKNLLSEHLRVTEEHKARLDKIQQVLSKGKAETTEKKKGFLSGIFGGSKHVCKGMQGIIEEGNKVMNTNMTPEVMDAAIIACVQKVEHYEICGYGTARTYARELGLEKEAVTLEKTLNEEYEADDRLTVLAVERVNLEAGIASSKGGDSSASGAAKGRGGRDTTKERTRQEEMETQSVSGMRMPVKKNNTSEEGGKPKSVSSPRSTQGRIASKSPAINKTKTSGKSAGSGSGRSATGEKNSASRGNTRDEK